MQCSIAYIRDGTIRVLTISGDLDTEGLLDIVQEQLTDPMDRMVRAILVDFSEIVPIQLTFGELRAVSEARNALRESFGDTRPTAVIAPAELVRGLTNIVAVLDRAPMGVFKTSEEALTWLESQISEGTGGGS